MNSYKKIIFRLTLLTLPLIHGCSQDKTTSKVSATKPPSSMENSIIVSDQDKERIRNIAKTEAEIYAKLKNVDSSFYGFIPSDTASDKKIIDYKKINLLSVKIVTESYDEKIKLFYNDSLLKVELLANIYSSTYTIAKKNQIYNPKVEIYINNRLLEEIIKERDNQPSPKQEIKTEEEISKIEAEIFSDLKQINGAYYRAMLGGATSDEQIAEYDKVNLLWVKIVSDDNISQIRLSFDENLFNEKIVIDNYLDPMYGGAYTIAKKHKLFNAQVEIYVKKRSLYNDIWKKR